MRQLRPAKRGVQRDRDRTEPCAAEHEIKQLDPVLAEQGDPVAGRDASRREVTGGPRRILRDLREAPLDRAEAQERLRSIGARLALEQSRKRLLFDRDAPQRGGRAEVEGHAGCLSMNASSSARKRSPSSNGMQ